MLLVRHVRVRVVLCSRDQRLVLVYFYLFFKQPQLTFSETGLSLEKMDDLFGVTELAERKLDAERGASVDNSDNKNSVEHNEHQPKQDQSTDTKSGVSEVERRL